MRPVVPRVLVVLAVAVFLGCGWNAVFAPFGDSHDGRNAAVWASGSRSVREEGPVASRLGAVSPDGVYATHPPLIYLETAVAEAVGGGSRAATRAPAWIGTVLALVLLARLGREAGLSPVASAGAALLVMATPMLLVYGTMLDTPVTSLPFALGLVLLWQRVRAGVTGPAWALGTLAALSALAGWQSLLVAGIVGIWAVVRLIRGEGSPRLNLAVVTGAVTGLVAVLLWQLWAFDWTLQPALDQFGVRTGSPPSARGGFLSRQRTDLANMFGAPLLAAAAAGLVLAVRNRRTRAPAAIGGAVAVAYTVAFRDGALAHDYWNYWLLWPVALGLATVLDRVGRVMGRVNRADGKLAAGVALVGAVAVVSLQLNPPTAARFFERGLPAGRLAEKATLPPGQATAWYAGVVTEPAAWLGYLTRRPAVLVDDPDLPALAASSPSDLVLVGRLECVPDRIRTVYAFEPAAAVAARPPAVACR